jgi:hypothetical protein
MKSLYDVPNYPPQPQPHPPYIYTRGVVGPNAIMQPMISPSVPIAHPMGTTGIPTIPLKPEKTERTTPPPRYDTTSQKRN